MPDATFFPPAQADPGDLERRPTCPLRFRPVRAWSSCASRPRIWCAPTAPATRPPARASPPTIRGPDEPLKLSGAQLVIAREHGFPSWPRLRAYVERLAAHGPGLQHAYHEDLEYYDDRAYGLLASAEDGTDGAVAAFGRHDAPLTREGARTVIAREHGFASWPALRRHVAGLRETGEPFARAYRAIEAHDVERLPALLDRFPELVGARGTNGNDLLGMAGATCDERLVAILLERGADVTRANAHGWTPLHQAAYSNLPAMARMLLDAGARTDVSARGDGGTPLVVALFWGNRETAELLAGHGLAPGNLRVAAGLGRLDLLDELIDARGNLAPEAGAHRAFYRPHSGFPAWQPSGDDARGPRRGADVGGAQRPRRGARAADRARRLRRGRRLPRHRPELGRRVRPRRRDPAAGGARRRPQPAHQLRRPRARRGHDAAPPRRPERRHGRHPRVARARSRPDDQGRASTTARPPTGPSTAATPRRHELLRVDQSRNP